MSFIKHINRKTMVSLLVSAALLSSGCQQEEEQQEQANQQQQVKTAVSKDQAHDQAEASPEMLFDNITTTLFAARPMDATMYGVSQEVAGGYYQDKLPDYSPAAEKALRQSLRHYADQLSELKSDTIQGEENRKVVIDLAHYYSGEKQFDIGFIDGWMGHSPFIVSQINGPAIDVPNLLQNNHPIKNEQNAKDYIARMAQFGDMIESVKSKVLADADKGWIPPKVIIKGALNFLNGFIAVEPEQHALVTNLQNKLDKLDLTAEQKEKMMFDAVSITKTTIYPAYKNLAMVMEDLLEKAPEESGIWAQPNGAEFYRYAVSELGNTDLTPEQVHQIGLDEVERITAEMDAILKSEGYDKGTVGERMAALNEEERFIYEDSDEGRQKLLDDLNGMLADINEVMPTRFATIPPYDVEIRRIPVERQDGAPGGQYTPPPLDGSEPGIYWINLKDMKANPKFDLKTLTYHEANPGHHWQIALNMAQESLPLIRRIAPYNAYVEGWALYSELVAWEMGMYKDDPYGDLGRLKAELFRAVRLVVDTGLHHKKWTREQAIQYMAEKTGTAQSSVISEIERYMVWPGQALGYKLGMLNIVDQRERAKEELGEAFDIKEFHDLVLLGGAVPMSVLNDKIDAWIESKKSKY
ncbi:DUF885 domain-containing protein [Kangiella profundi]|uniref:DUF885 domain-containing protein n=1 Tax=Kangiella profundi TaxID=1561924 RepID=A0A2K9AGD6_9GAMM|nr:DUF885 domain-containing protein [Kangiella profundi]AUD78014.1 DUF885 domain-containing protein [Kangiella profundi]MBD3668837.1 DUF885 domain-containing protein [Kangiella sp.]GGE90622.1 Tat pathway signal protein [Kangiella profundi]